MAIVGRSRKRCFTRWQSSRLLVSHKNRHWGCPVSVCRVNWSSFLPICCFAVVPFHSVIRFCRCDNEDNCVASPHSTHSIAIWSPRWTPSSSRLILLLFPDTTWFWCFRIWTKEVVFPWTFITSAPLYRPPPTHHQTTVYRADSGTDNRKRRMRATGDEAEVGESAFPIREFLTSLNSPRRVVAELTLNCNLMQSWNAAFTSPWSPLFIAWPQDEQ